jgi:ankyrin repeat protein
MSHVTPKLLNPAFLGMDFSEFDDVSHVTPQTVNLQDDDGNTPLHLCGLHGSEKTILYLLENGANPNIQNES